MDLDEEWRVINEFPRYAVSSYGRVRNLITGRTLKPGLNSDGYPGVVLTDGYIAKSRKVHRLVATAFLPTNDFSLEVNHIDGDKTYNCVENLEWVTRSQNQRHAFANGLYSRKGGKIMVVETGQIFETQQECADAIGASQSGVAQALSGRWRFCRGYTIRYLED